MFVRNITCLLVLLLALGGCSLHQKKLVFDSHIIEYGGSVTRVEAAKLGAFLRNHPGDMEDVHVYLTKVGLEYHLKWVVPPTFSLLDPIVEKLVTLEKVISASVFDGNEVKIFVSEPDFSSCRAVTASLGEKLDVEDETFFYKAPVKRRQAKKVYNLLKKYGYYAEGKSLAQLERYGDAYYCRMEIPDWQQQTDHKMEWAERLRKEIEDSLFNYSLVTIELCGRMLQTEKSIEADPYEKTMSFRSDKVIYSKEILPRDITKLGKYLTSRDLFMNQGKVVKVLKKENRYQVAFRAIYGVDDQHAVHDAEKLSTELSKHVFRGDPVYVHIYDQSKKQKMIYSTMVY